MVSTAGAGFTEHQGNKTSLLCAGQRPGKVWGQQPHEAIPEALLTTLIVQQILVLSVTTCGALMF